MFKVRRVSLGVVTGTRVSVVELLSRRITGTNSGRTEVIQLPALELILWSSY